MTGEQAQVYGPEGQSIRFFAEVFKIRSIFNTMFAQKNNFT
jgi:hypothetical protein